MNWIKNIGVYLSSFVALLTHASMRRVTGMALPTLSQTTGVGMTAISIIYSVVLWSRLIAVFLNSICADRAPRLMAVLGSALFLIGCVGVFFNYTSYIFVLIMFAVMSIGQFVAGYNVQSTIVKADSFGKVYDLLPVVISRGLSNIVFGILLAFFITYFTIGGSYLVNGILAVLSVVVFCYFTRNLKLQIKPSIKTDIRTISKNKGILRLMLLMAAYDGVYMALAAVFMFYLKEVYIGWSMAQLIALYTTTSIIPAICGKPIWAVIAHKWNAKKALGISNIFTMLGILTAVFYPIAGCIIVGFAGACGTLCIMPYLADRWGRMRMAEIFGVISIPAMAVSSFFPILAGYLYSSFGFAILGFVMCFVVLMAFLFFVLEKDIVYKEIRTGKA
jgi:MFS family permease